jgi:hypothetical protein
MNDSPILQPLTPIKMKWMSTFVFVFVFGFVLCGGHEKQMGRKKQKRWCQMYHSLTINLCFGLHCFFMHFCKGKGHKPQEHYYN